MDLEVMPRSYRGHKYILCMINEVTNYLIPIPTHEAKLEQIGDALIENFITKYCIPEYIIMDQDSAFMSSLMNYLFHKFDIKIKTVALYNYQSLQAEHGIKSLSNILTKYLQLATFAYNRFNTPNLRNHSQYELIFGRKLRSLLNLESTSDIKVSGTFKEYYELLNKRLKYLLLDFESKRLAMINKNRDLFQYNSGD